MTFTNIKDEDILYLSVDAPYLLHKSYLELGFWQWQFLRRFSERSHFAALCFLVCTNICWQNLNCGDPGGIQQGLWSWWTEFLKRLANLYPVGLPESCNICFQFNQLQALIFSADRVEERFCPPWPPQSLCCPVRALFSSRAHLIDRLLYPASYLRFSFWTRTPFFHLHYPGKFVRTSFRSSETDHGVIQ